MKTMSKFLIAMFVMMSVACGDEPQTYFDNTELPEEHGTPCEKILTMRAYGEPTQYVYLYDGIWDCTEQAIMSCRCLKVEDFEKKFGKD